MSYMELDAYQRLTGDRLSPWEIDLIRAMARAEAAHHAERIRNARRS